MFLYINCTPYYPLGRSCGCKEVLCIGRKISYMPWSEAEVFRKGLVNVYNYFLVSTDLYHTLTLWFFWLGTQPCPSWKTSNFWLHVFLCGVMIHTTPPIYWFDQPHTINPPTAPSWTPGCCINIYIITWVFKLIKQNMYHMAHVFMLMGVYRYIVCDVT